MKKHYEEGAKAKKRFEDIMTALFRVPKSVVTEKIKVKKKKGKTGCPAIIPSTRECLVMNVPLATNFNDYVSLMSVNAPHALVMDWWRRLDFTLHEYAATLGHVVRNRDRRPIDAVVPLNDAALTTCIRALRHERNRVTHKSCYLSSEDATAYAREAFRVIGTLARRISHLEGKGQKPG